MYIMGKQQIALISAYAGERKDYVQGGGGNTSVKFDGTYMAIKASGCALTDVTPESGYVIVDYQKIKKYYDMIGFTKSTDYEKESLEVNIDSVTLANGTANIRPSVEVGFHSFLQKYVIHTHSVYANVLCCSKEGELIANNIFKDCDFGYVFLPYTDPGFKLTLNVKQALKIYEMKHGAQPDAVFLKNHGLIVHSNDSETITAIHEKVNGIIKSYLKFDDFPIPKVTKYNDGYTSDTEYMKNYISENHLDEDFLNRFSIYPDQLVYLGKRLGTAVKISGGKIIYNTGFKEAQAVEETLLGVIYVIDSINRSGLTLSEMDKKSMRFINSWESEKYRSDKLLQK